MSTYGMEKVFHMWEVGRLTTEQAIGQMLQLMRDMDERIKELEREKERREREERDRG